MAEQTTKQFSFLTTIEATDFILSDVPSEVPPNFSIFIYLIEIFCVKIIIEHTGYHFKSQYFQCLSDILIFVQNN